MKVCQFHYSYAIMFKTKQTSAEHQITIHTSCTASDRHNYNTDDCDQISSYGAPREKDAALSDRWRLLSEGNEQCDEKGKQDDVSKETAAVVAVALAVVDAPIQNIYSPSASLLIHSRYRTTDTSFWRQWTVRRAGRARGTAALLDASH